MAYLILRIEAKDDARMSREEREAQRALGNDGVVELIAVRHSVRQPTILEFKAAGAKRGWEIAHVLYGPEEAAWPFTAYAYVSPCRSGKGRFASTLHRLPCRRIPGD